MFTSIPSLDVVLECLLPAFTQPSFQTHLEVFLGWVMCLGRRTEFGVFTDPRTIARRAVPNVAKVLSDKQLRTGACPAHSYGYDPGRAAFTTCTSAIVLEFRFRT